MHPLSCTGLKHRPVSMLVCDTYGKSLSGAERQAKDEITFWPEGFLGQNLSLRVQFRKKRAHRENQGHFLGDGYERSSEKPLRFGVEG